MEALLYVTTATCMGNAVSCKERDIIPKNDGITAESLAHFCFGEFYPDAALLPRSNNMTENAKEKKCYKINH